MTKFTALFGVIGRRRLKTVVQALGIWLVATIVATGLSVWANRASHSDESWLVLAAGWGASLLLLTGVIIFFQLAFANERVWTQAQYRLLPASDTKLYLANHSASLLALVAFWLVGGLIVLAVAAVSGVLAGGHFYGTVLDVVEMGLLLVVMTLFFWALISTENLLVATIRAFLPESRGSLITGILYVVTIVVVLWVLDRLTDLIALPFGGSVFSTQISDNASFVLATLSFTLLAALLTVLNIALLKRFVEPKA